MLAKGGCVRTPPRLRSSPIQIRSFLIDRHAIGRHAPDATRPRRRAHARPAADSDAAATSSSRQAPAAAPVVTPPSPPPAWLSTQHDRDIMALALPAALALAADPLLGMIDTALVGRLGADELAALGVNSSLFTLAFVVFNFLATATTPLVATAHAAGDARRAGETVWQAGALALLLGAGVSATLLFGGNELLMAMGVDDSQPHMQQLALSYLQLRACAAPAVLLATVGQGVFRGIGNMRVPLAITVAVNALHLALDLQLMYGWGWGIRGAAVSTTASEWLAAGAYIWLAWAQREELGLWPPPPAVTPRELQQRMAPFLQAGGAVIMRTGSLLGTKTLATAVAARLGPSSVASHQVLMQLWVLTSMLIDSLAVSGQTLIAVHLGRGMPGPAREVGERLLALGLGSGLCLAALLGAGAGSWPGLFASDADVLQQVRALLPLALAPLPVNALVYTFDGILVGASDFNFLMGAMLGASALAAGLLLVVEPAGLGLQGVWAALAVLMVARFATLSVRFQSLSGPLPPPHQRRNLAETPAVMHNEQQHGEQQQLQGWQHDDLAGLEQVQQQQQQLMQQQQQLDQQHDDLAGLEQVQQQQQRDQQHDDLAGLEQVQQQQQQQGRHRYSKGARVHNGVDSDAVGRMRVTRSAAAQQQQQQQQAAACGRGDASAPTGDSRQHPSRGSR